MVRKENYLQPSFPWILTAKNGPAPKSVQILDYEHERQHNADYYARLKTLQSAGRSVRDLPDDEKRTLEEQAPRPIWPAAALINQMGALNTYNKTIERWASCRDVYPELIHIIWTLFSGEPRAVEQAEQAWQDSRKGAWSR